MNNLSLEPDECNRWIYDNNNPDYHSDLARSLRDRRDAALRSAPEWMIRVAELNDSMKRGRTEP